MVTFTLLDYQAIWNNSEKVICTAIYSDWDDHFVKVKGLPNSGDQILSIG